MPKKEIFHVSNQHGDVSCFQAPWVYTDTKKNTETETPPMFQSTIDENDAIFGGKFHTCHRERIHNIWFAPFLWTLSFTP